MPENDYKKGESSKNITLSQDQEKVLRLAFDPARPKFQEIVMPVGSGKTTVLSVVLSKLYEHHTKARVLLLSPVRVLSKQLKYILQKSGVDVSISILDWPSYLRLLDEGRDGGSLWSTQSIVIVDASILKAKELQASILNTRWDLVAMDDIHSKLSIGELEAFIYRLSESENIQQILSFCAIPSTLEIDEAARVTIEPPVQYTASVIGAEDQEYIEYTFSDEEKAIQAKVTEICCLLQRLGSSGKDKAHTLKIRSDSSFYSLSFALSEVRKDILKLRNMIAHGLKPQQPSPQSGSDLSYFQVLGDGTQHELDEASVLLVLELIEEAMDTLDELSSDAKGEALASHLEQQVSDDRAGSHICIFTVSAHTASYLQSISEAICDKVYLVSSRQEPPVNEASIEGYCKGGGLLICQDGAAKGLEVSSAGQCIQYDFVNEPRISYLRISMVRSIEGRCTLLSLRERGGIPD
ncbi:MAG: DEAD/DEAH box helicase family protein [Halioglobus sp.]